MKRDYLNTPSPPAISSSIMIVAGYLKSSLIPLQQVV